MKEDKPLSEDTRSKLLKIGLVMFFAGIIVFLLGTPFLTKSFIPQEYTGLVLLTSLSFIPSGAALIMSSKLLVRTEYILAIVVFLVFLAGFILFGPSKSLISGQSKINVCCSSFILSDGTCSHLPEPFEADWDGDGIMENCTSLSPGNSLEEWRESCPCPS